MEGQSAVNIGSRLLKDFRACRSGPLQLRPTAQRKGLGAGQGGAAPGRLRARPAAVTAAHDDRPQVRSPADAANLVMSEMMTLEQEHLKVLLLDTKNRVIHVTTCTSAR